MGTEGIKAKMPITIKDIRVTAEMQIDLLFFPMDPYIKEMDIAFRFLPSDWLGFNIKAMGAFNVLSLPVLKEWVLGAITSGVKVRRGAIICVAFLSLNSVSPPPGRTPCCCLRRCTSIWAA